MGGRRGKTGKACEKDEGWGGVGFEEVRTEEKMEKEG